MKGGKEDMTEKRFELRLCSNGIYYVYENGTLTDIDFDKFNKESAYAILDEVNALYDENGQLRKENDMLSCELSVSANKEISRNCRIAELEEENEQLKQYKQSVNDVLRSWSQKNLTAKQLQVVLAIMEELNVIGDVE